MTQRILSGKLNDQFRAMRELLQQCLSLAEKCREEESIRILRERLAHLQSAALFVIVGEVKAGKSSFVNALLGEEVCEVAPDPCTVGIQELVYAEERDRMVLGDNWERIFLPKEVLREITIVDTPGTNSVIANHQKITEDYIALSDLVVFVFPAKNPHTGSAWELLTLIRKEWRRKTVFVLQQADLASQRELAVNKERVEQYARERGVQNPVVFTLSAKRESEGASDSGFTEFREFLRDAVETGEVWRLKVEGTRDTVQKIAGSLLAELLKSQAALADDRAFYQHLLARVAAHREKADNLRHFAVRGLCDSYDRLAAGLEGDFAEGISAGNILRRAIPFIRDKDVQTWMKELHAGFEDAVKKEIDADSMRVSKDISDAILSMFGELTRAIDQRQGAGEKGIAGAYPDREEILLRLKRQLEALRIADIADKGVQSSDVGNLSLAGGGIAALGAVIALATKLVIFDITGGVMAVMGAGLIAVTLLWKRKAMIGDFSRKMEKSRQEFRDRIEKEIAGIFDRLFMEIDQRLKEPLGRLDADNARLAPLIDEAQQVIDRTKLQEE